MGEEKSRQRVNSVVNISNFLAQQQVAMSTGRCESNQKTGEFVARVVG